jgi:septation ring formation regulator EzrA
MQVDLKRSATIIEMIASFVTILVVIVSAYVSITVTQARQDERIKQLENNYNEIKDRINNVDAGIREVNKGQTEILLQLKDKQDRTLK